MKNKYCIHTKYISGGSYWSGWYHNLYEFINELKEVLDDDDLANDMIELETESDEKINREENDKRTTN